MRSRSDERKETAMRRILLVDDDPHVGQAIRVWRQHQGWASTANDGAADVAALDDGALDLMNLNTKRDRAVFPAALRRHAPRLE